MPDDLYERDALAWARSAAPHWRGETASFLAGARRSFTPSMLRRIDPAELYADALYEVRTETDGDEIASLPERCPFQLDDLLSERPDVATLASRLSGQA